MRLINLWNIVSMILQAMTAGMFTFLVGPIKPDRLEVRGQTKDKATASIYFNLKLCLFLVIFLSYFPISCFLLCILLIYLASLSC